jgi:lysophospholipase L1-like esterase
VTIVVAVGDSIAYGVGDIDRPGGHPAWSGRVSRLIDAGNVNLGQTGAVLRDVESRVTAVLAECPDIVLVSIGGNDIVRGPFDSEIFVDRLAACLASFRTTGATVVVLTIPDLSRTMRMPGIMRRPLHSRTHSVNAALTSAAETTASVVVDRWSDPRSYLRMHVSVDGAHPSPAGYQHLANRTVSVLDLPVTQEPMPSHTEEPHRAIWLATSGLAWVVRRFPLAMWSVVTLLLARPDHGHECTGCDPVAAGHDRGTDGQASQGIPAIDPRVFRR